MSTYILFNIYDSLPFITISARSSNGSFADGIGVAGLMTSGEYYKVLIAVAFELFTNHRLAAYGFII